jgi:hypothetical protein
MLGVHFGQRAFASLANAAGRAARIDDQSFSHLGLLEELFLD